MSAGPTTAAPPFPAPIADGVKAAIESTFRSILGDAPAIAPDDGDASAWSGLIGIISFLGDINWTFSLGIPQATAPALIEKFAGFAIPFDSPDMNDVIGELANVIAGDIVAQLDRRKIKAQMSLPMVVRGSEIEVTPPGGALSLRVACGSAFGSFWYKLAAAKTGSLALRRPGT